MDAGKIWVQLGLDDTQFKNGIKQTEAHLGAMGKKIQGVGQNLSLALTLPLAAMGAAAFKFASDLDEAMNKTDVAFKDSAGTVQEWSKTTLTNLGLSQGAALDAAALFGDMATSMGLVPSAAADMSMSLVALGADLASFKNISTDQASNALKGIFTGETESLKSLGIVMTQQQLETFALANGYNKLMKDMTQAELVQLRYNYVMSVTTNAQGDFIRTSDGAANQMRIFTESIKEVSASFGQILLPIITPMIQKVNALMAKIATLSEEQKKWIIGLAGIAAAIGPVLYGIGTLMTKIPAMGNALGTLVKIARTVTTALMANPYLAAAAAIIFLISVLYMYGKTQEDLKKDWEALKKAWTDTRAFEQIMKSYRDIFGGLWKIVEDVVGAFQGLLSIFGIGASAAGAFETVISALLVTFKFASLPLRGLISLLSTFTGIVKGIVDIVKNWKNLSMEDIFTKIGDGIRDLVRNNPLTDFAKSVKQVFTGAEDYSFSFQRAMKFDFNEMRKTAKEGILTVEEMATKFADSFEGMSESQRESIKTIRLEYLQSVDEWIQGALDKLKAENMVNRSLSDQVQALDAFVKEVRAKMDESIAAITGSGTTDFPIGGTEGLDEIVTSEQELEKALKSINDEYQRASVLARTREQLLEAELKAVEDTAEAYRQYYAIDGYSAEELAILNAYQIEINGVKSRLEELQKQKEKMAADTSYKESLQAEIDAIRESLLTEEQLIRKSYDERVNIIDAGLEAGIILSMEEANALIMKLTEEMNKSLQGNSLEVKSWANTWKEALDSIGDAMESMVTDMAIQFIEGMAQIGKGTGAGMKLLSTFLDGMKQIGKVIIGAAIGFLKIGEALRTALATPAGAIAAIAAGGALIALATIAQSSLAAAGNVQGLATGGSVYQGGVFKVGEQGEELVTLPRGAAVTPNHMLQGMNGNMILTSRISGRDLEIILERTSSQTHRR